MNYWCLIALLFDYTLKKKGSSLSADLKMWLCFRLGEIFGGVQSRGSVPRIKRQTEAFAYYRLKDHHQTRWATVTVSDFRLKETRRLQSIESQNWTQSDIALIRRGVKKFSRLFKVENLELEICRLPLHLQNCIRVKFPQKSLFLFHFSIINIAVGSYLQHHGKCLMHFKVVKVFFL